jgi:hypothetical protein
MEKDPHNSLATGWRVTVSVRLPPILQFEHCVLLLHRVVEFFFPVSALRRILNGEISLNKIIILNYNFVQRDFTVFFKVKFRNFKFLKCRQFSCIIGVGTRGTAGYIVPPKLWTCTPCTPPNKKHDLCLISSKWVNPRHSGTNPTQWDPSLLQYFIHANQLNACRWNGWVDGQAFQLLNQKQSGNIRRRPSC